jgi:hypothetical protein
MPLPAKPKEPDVKVFGLEPSVIVYGLNALVALLVSFGLPLSHAAVAAVATVATAVLAIVVAAMTRPVVVSTITGAIGTLLVAVGAFGLHFSTDQIGAATAFLSIVLALLLRQAVTPAAKVRA